MMDISLKTARHVVGQETSIMSMHENFVEVMASVPAQDTISFKIVLYYTAITSLTRGRHPEPSVLDRKLKDGRRINWLQR